MNIFLKVIIIFSIIVSLNKSNASEIIKISNDKALIDTEGELFEEGDSFYFLNSNNEKVGGLKITVVKNRKALGRVIKGTPEVGQHLLKVAKKEVQKDDQPEEVIEKKPIAKKSNVYSNSKNRWGLIPNLKLNSQKLNLTDGTNSFQINATGTNIVLSTFIDYKSSEHFSNEFEAEFENFNTNIEATTALCDNLSSVTCTTKISYLSLSYLPMLNSSSGNFLIGPFFKMKFPIKKSSTAVDQTTIKTAFAYGLKVNYFYTLSNKVFIPITTALEKTSSDGTVSLFGLQVGLGIGLQF